MDAQIKYEPLGNLLVGGADFRPLAYYDKNLDTIRVQILDCRMYEERLDRIVTLCRAVSDIANEADQIVGFAIEGVRYIFDSIGIEARGTVGIAKLLDAIVEVYPTYSTKLVREVFGSWPATKPRQVDFATG